MPSSTFVSFEVVHRYSGLLDLNKLFCVLQLDTLEITTYTNILESERQK